MKEILVYTSGGDTTSGEMGVGMMFPVEEQGKDCESKGGEILVVTEDFSLDLYC